MHDDSLRDLYVGRRGLPTQADAVITDPIPCYLLLLPGPLAAHPRSTLGDGWHTLGVHLELPQDARRTTIYCTYSCGRRQHHMGAIVWTG